MKQIKIKQLRLLNFKGVRELSVDLKGDITSIAGRNGSGKTTIFDAFTWLLFGKDSYWRKQFDIKTLDGQGAAIPRLPHEVTATLSIDGKDITLTRRYNEKWVRRRGSAAEEFSGHEEERLYNDVPCNLKEWTGKIADICNEEMFKMITSPSYFTAQKPETQRAVLIKMAGGFTDNEVIAASGQRADFIELLGTLCGKSIEEYKREIAAKKRLLKAEIDGIPDRIDERKRDNEQYKDIDYAAIEAEIAQKQTALADIDKTLTQLSERVNAADRAKQQLYTDLSKVREQIAAIYHNTRRELDDKYDDADRAYSELTRQSATLSADLSLGRLRAQSLTAQIADNQTKAQQLRDEYKAIAAQTLTLTKDDYYCPTCGQPLEASKMEQKRAEMLAKFNTRKADQLKDINGRGRYIVTQITALQAELDKTNKDITEYESAIAVVEQNLKGKAKPVQPTDNDVAEVLKGNAEYVQLKEQGQTLKTEIDKAVDPTDTAELTEARKLLTEGIAQLQGTLSGRQYKQRNDERIAELDAQLRAQADALSQLEGIEFTIADFCKARINAVEAKIASMFQLVKFKMYDTQINGGEVETCEAMVGGVPYSSLNNAMRINAGLDIINAICKYQSIAAPIFIDNCESILEPLATEGQQIRLIVADKDLTIN